MTEPFRPRPANANGGSSVATPAAVAAAAPNTGGGGGSVGAGVVDAMGRSLDALSLAQTAASNAAHLDPSFPHLKDKVGPRFRPRFRPRDRPRSPSRCHPRFLPRVSPRFRPRIGNLTSTSVSISRLPRLVVCCRLVTCLVYLLPKLMTMVFFLFFLNVDDGRRGSTAPSRGPSATTCSTNTDTTATSWSAPRRPTSVNLLFFPFFLNIF